MTESWNPLLHGSNSQKAAALVGSMTDPETGEILFLQSGGMATLAAAQVYATLALEDAIRERSEQ